MCVSPGKTKFNGGEIDILLLVGFRTPRTSQDLLQSSIELSSSFFSLLPSVSPPGYGSISWNGYNILVTPWNLMPKRHESYSFSYLKVFRPFPLVQSFLGICWNFIELSSKKNTVIKEHSLYFSVLRYLSIILNNYNL